MDPRLLPMPRVQPQLQMAAPAQHAGRLQLIDLNAVTPAGETWNGGGGTWYAPGEWEGARRKGGYDHVAHGDCFRMGVALLGLMCGTCVPHESNRHRGQERYVIAYDRIHEVLPGGDLGDLLHHTLTMETAWETHPWWDV